MEGCVHLYTGDGKGKTCAAVGLAVRAAGQGLRVGFYQFMKNGRSGEVAALEKLGVAVDSPLGPAKFVWEMDEAERAAFAALQQGLLDRAAAQAGELDVLVLDEVVCALGCGLLPAQALDAFLDGRPAALEVVLTGRGAGEALMRRADYVTEMRQLAHPFGKGLAARRGIEY